VTEGGVEGAAAIEVMVPGHRVVVAVSSAGVGGFVYFNQDVDIGVEVFEIVQFIKMGPGVGEACGGGVVLSTIKNRASCCLGCDLK
jgi:uncharacterized membrane protein YjjB (DUF3815 family)